MTSLKPRPFQGQWKVIMGWFTTLELRVEFPKSWIQDFNASKSWISRFFSSIKNLNHGTSPSWIQDFGRLKSFNLFRICIRPFKSSFQNRVSRILHGISGFCQICKCHNSTRTILLRTSVSFVVIEGIIFRTPSLLLCSKGRK